MESFKFYPSIASQKILQKNDSAYTLVEIMMVVVILGIIASLAIPNYQIAVENSRSAEGVNILTTILGAEKRWALENGNIYTVNMSDLDFTTGYGGFNAAQLANPQPAFGSNGVVASITRNNAKYDYTLSISDQGTVTCANGAGTPICKKMGY